MTGKPTIDTVKLVINGTGPNPDAAGFGTVRGYIVQVYRPAIKAKGEVGGMQLYATHYFTTAQVTTADTEGVAIGGLQSSTKYTFVVTATTATTKDAALYGDGNLKTGQKLSMSKSAAVATAKWAAPTKPALATGTATYALSFEAPKKDTGSGYTNLAIYYLDVNGVEKFLCTVSATVGTDNKGTANVPKADVSSAQKGKGGKYNFVIKAVSLDGKGTGEDNIVNASLGVATLKLAALP
jgi:hypothetical protein